MSLFSLAVDGVFTAFGVPALYSAAGGGAPVQVTVLVRRPDEIVTFGETRIHAETSLFEVRTAEVPAPGAGDRLLVGGEAFVIQGEPTRDAERLTWKLEAVPE